MIDEFTRQVTKQLINHKFIICIVRQISMHLGFDGIRLVHIFSKMAKMLKMWYASIYQI